MLLGLLDSIDKHRNWCEQKVEKLKFLVYVILTELQYFIFLFLDIEPQ